MKALSDFKFNAYSQFGEDGIIKEIFSRLEKSGISLNKWVCEFGAWDGLHLSNTARLIVEEGFSAVLIEGDPDRVKWLSANFPDDRVKKICSFVTHVGETSLEKILSTTNIPPNFDFLSIDIDGMDYYILESLQMYKPKLISIEFNPTIPNMINFVQPENYSLKQGASARAIYELATRMNYSVVAGTHCNLFLLSNEFSQIFDRPLPSLEELVPHGQDVTYLFSGYDGTLLSNKSFIKLGWHGSFPLSSIQLLPKFLRVYSGDYNRLQRYFLRLILFGKSTDKFNLLKRRITTLLNGKKQSG